jgi:hypothetical protein
MDDPMLPVVKGLAGQDEQDAFAQIIDPIVAALPAAADAELLSNIVAAIITEFCTDAYTVRWVCMFAEQVAAAELKRQSEKVN